MKGLSQHIVDFIATLEPSYTRQLADGHDCALSLADGTLLMPLDESHAPTEEGWVAVLWQGDGQRRSEVPGSLLASRAVLQHVALLGVGHAQPALAGQREELRIRFMRATGLDLRLEVAATSDEALHSVA